MASKPPTAYEEFKARFPILAEGWDTLGRGAREGMPLDEKSVALVKLGLALGARYEGPFHSAVRKARDLGVSREEMEQVLALSATTLGLPSAVAGFTWMKDILDAD